MIRNTTGTVPELTEIIFMTVANKIFLFAAFEGLVYSESSSYIAVVAIDFGTTYSGFAFAFNHKEGKGGIHMNKAWGHDQGGATLKTPTSLLLRPDGQFDSFGYEADEKYANFVCGEDREYLYFKQFKMKLHQSEVNLKSVLMRETYIKLYTLFREERPRTISYQAGSPV